MLKKLARGFRPRSFDSLTAATLSFECLLVCICVAAFDVCIVPWMRRHAIQRTFHF